MAPVGIRRKQYMGSESLVGRIDTLKGLKVRFALAKPPLR